jgi:capsule polysaccharide export protein KpsE/RkpR
MFISCTIYLFFWLKECFCDVVFFTLLACNSYISASSKRLISYVRTHAAGSGFASVLSAHHASTITHTVVHWDIYRITDIDRRLGFNYCALLGVVCHVK